LKRFYCANLDAGELDPDESHHCLHVMRLKNGDICSLFNGQGIEWKAQITGVKNDRAQFKKTAETRTPAAPDSICLAQALTKGKSMDLIIQKATELGISEIAPLQSSRSVSQLEGDQAESRIQKWRQLTIEAAKQCGQNWLPQIRPLCTPKFFVEGNLKTAIKLIGSLQPEASPLKQVLREAIPAASSPRKIIVMIGPEGDFTPAEIGEARARGFLPISLGRSVLRSETAAIYTLSAVIYELS
jgi:16S rRNA (uracil1498-N3)-methyltransferase